MALELDEAERIEKLGMRVRACAVGQAAAAIFARHAAGKSEADLRAAQAAMRAWLDGTGEMPDWPDLRLIAPARDYPGRHGAILLPWDAAIGALSTASATG
jgi:NifU-like protein involved in Fe-S cluster formation